MSRLFPLLSGLLFLAGLLIPRPALAADYPVRLGLNTSGDWHMYHTSQLCFQSEAFFKAVKEFNPDFIDVLFLAKHALVPTTMTEAQMIAQLKELDAAMTSHGFNYTINLEVAGWSKSMIVGGKNIFDQADGTHRFDVPMAWLNEVLPPKRPGTPRLLAMNQDEGEHHQLLGGFYTGGQNYDRPYYRNVDGVSLAKAFDMLVERVAWIKNTHYQGRVALKSEQVNPDLFHIFAKAGCIVTPKILQELIAPVALSNALGAALQYRDQPGMDLWVMCEISRGGRVPGWPPQALRSALLMGYWIGASGLYIENLDYGDSPNPHPLATQHPGALLYWTTPDKYVLTKHGQVAKDFYRNYVPANPRPINWRDYRPRVAIIRLPDGCTGHPTDMPRDRMLGQRNHPATDVNAEWLKIWPILTHGFCRPGACSMWHMNHTYPDYFTLPFFVPIDSVAVFDHTVHGPVLDSVRCFVVCGEELSKATFDELKWRTARQGAVVIIARRLYDRNANDPLPGNWLIVDDFSDPAIARKLKPFLGEPNVARYRFKNHTVEFRPTGEVDSISVTVKPAANEADAAWLKPE